MQPIYFNSPGYNVNSIVVGGQGGTGAPPPTTGAGAGPMGGVSMGISIGAAIGSVYSAWASGRALDYVIARQREINIINAKIAQFGVEAAHREGEDITAQLTNRAGQIKGAQRAHYAANGVAVDVGSAGEVQASTEIMKEIDKRTAAMNALSKAWGYRQQGANVAAQGIAAVAQYQARKDQAYDRAVSNVLESASLVADRWYKYKRG